MSNLATIKSITDNLQTVLRAKGIKFERKIDEENIKATQLPAGQIFYRGEEFEYAHGMKPKWIEASFAIKVMIRERDAQNLIESTQEWVHNIREAINVNALNIGDLSSSKLVSRADTETADVEYPEKDTAMINTTVVIRYREL